MEPISLIATALTAGVALGLKDVASHALADAYTRLKDLTRQRLGGEESEGAAVLARHEKSPQAWEVPLAEMLRESGADRDPELLAAARAVLEEAQAQEPSEGKYALHLHDAQGVQVGDGNAQANVFGAGSGGGSRGSE